MANQQRTSALAFLDQARFSCTCPDWGNPCKHVGALLLHWSTDPDAFARLRSEQDILKSIESLPKKKLVKALSALVRADERLTKRVDEALSGKYISDLDENEDASEDEDEESEESGSEPNYWHY